MSGETNLRTLIEEMSPVLDQEEYVSPQQLRRAPMHISR